MQRGLPGQLRWSSLLLGRKERLTVGLSLGQSYLVRGNASPPFLSSLVSCMYLFLVAWTLSILQPRDQPAQPSSLFPSPEGELAEPPPAGLQGFLFFLGPSPEPRRKPALYRDVDATLLGELKPLKGRGRWSSPGRAEAVGCEPGMILIANSLL